MLLSKEDRAEILNFFVEEHLKSYPKKVRIGFKFLTDSDLLRGETGYSVLGGTLMLRPTINEAMGLGAYIDINFTNDLAEDIIRSAYRSSIDRIEYRIAWHMTTLFLNDMERRGSTSLNTIVNNLEEAFND